MSHEIIEKPGVKAIDDSAMAVPATRLKPTLEAIIRTIDATIAGGGIQSAKEAATPAEIEFAVPPASSVVSGRYIVFSVGGNKFAVSIDQVKEVTEARAITPVPNTPDWVLGVTHREGDIVSVVDCASFLNPESEITSCGTSMCIVKDSTGELSTSLLVDAVEGMLTLPSQPLMKAQGIMNGPVGAYLAGVYDYQGTLLSVLDMEKLLSAMAVA